MSLFQTRDYTLRQLQYAVAVADTGGFGRAARVCGVSQPSLSAQVALLETSLGLCLFERHARKVHVTQAGRALLPRMRAVLLASHALDDERHQLLAPGSVVLRVGVIPTVAPYLVPRITESLRADPARPRVLWRELLTAECDAALASGELDAIFIADPPSLPSAEHVQVGFDPFALLVSADCPLRGPVTQVQVGAQELLLLEEGHCLRDHTLAYCAQGTQEAPFRATSLGTLVQMVAADHGVCVVPASALAVGARRAKVRALRFVEPVPGRVLRLAWRARSPHTACLKQLALLFSDALKAEIGDGALAPPAPDRPSPRPGAD